MIERSKEDIRRIVEKWKHVLNAPLSGSPMAMIIEPQEKNHTMDEIISSIEDDVFKQYVENFKHGSNCNPDGFISLLVKHKMEKRQNDL